MKYNKPIRIASHQQPIQQQTALATVDWDLFATESFCKYLQMFKIAKNLIAKNFNGYIVFTVVMNFRKNFSIAKIFPSRSPGIFANIFKRKIIPVYSIWSGNGV